MAQWNDKDAANGSPIWGPALVSKEPTANNRDALYGNVTADVFVPGATKGVFAVDEEESLMNPDIPSTGWVMRTEGSGGRAGRVTYEVMVAGGITSDNSDDDAVLPNSPPAP